MEKNSKAGKYVPPHLRGMFEMCFLRQYPVNLRLLSARQRNSDTN